MVWQHARARGRDREMDAEDEDIRDWNNDKELLFDKEDELDEVVREFELVEEERTKAWASTASSYQRPCMRSVR